MGRKNTRTRTVRLIRERLVLTIGERQSKWHSISTNEISSLAIYLLRARLDARADCSLKLNKLSRMNCEPWAFKYLVDNLVHNGGCGNDISFKKMCLGLSGYALILRMLAVEKTGFIIFLCFRCCSPGWETLIRIFGVILMSNCYRPTVENKPSPKRTRVVLRRSMGKND